MIDFSLTPAAVTWLLRILDQDGQRRMLRVSVHGGGCAGLEHRLDTTDRAEAGDLRVEQEGVVVLVDPDSAPYLDGGRLDYVVEAFGSRLVVVPAQGQATCGCGKSFSG